MQKCIRILLYKTVSQKHEPANKYNIICNEILEYVPLLKK